MLPRLRFAGAGVVVDDLARQMQAERDESRRPFQPTSPTSLPGGRANRLPIEIQVAVRRELVLRPRERRGLAQPPSMSSTSMRTCTNRRPLRRDWVIAATRVTGVGVERADGLAIERRRGSVLNEVPRSALSAGNRTVDIDRRCPVERQIHLLFVFVLLEQARRPPQPQPP